MFTDLNTHNKSILSELVKLIQTRLPTLLLINFLIVNRKLNLNTLSLIVFYILKIEYTGRNCISDYFFKLYF